jgi:Calcineurin-like phosphoesterase
VLAGDICAFSHSHRLIEFLAAVRPMFAHVVYVPGNHEYYQTELPQKHQTELPQKHQTELPQKHQTELPKWTPPIVEMQLRQICGELGVEFLQCNSVDLEGVRFLGCTLWTNISAMTFGTLNDARYIPEWTRADHTGTHLQHRQWLEQQLRVNNNKSGPPVVVVTHHVPAHHMIPAKFVGFPTNDGWCANCTTLMTLGSHNLRAWICGHTHAAHDSVYTDGLEPVRCVINPRGYSTEQGINGYDPNKGFDI